MRSPRSGEPEVDGRKLREELLAIAPRILPFMDTVWHLLDTARRAQKRILFEGAQGIMLDIDFGTYPFVTSSNTIAAQAASGWALGRTCWATCWASPRPTRRGSAPVRFRPSCSTRPVIASVSAARVRHRDRAQAALRLVRRRLVRQAIKTSGISGIALTKLDVLDGFDEIKICVRLQARWRVVDYLPARQGAQARVSRCTRPWKAGRTRPPEPGPGLICRRRRSSMCARSRN
jgi:adenylosuccinate synthase